MPNVTLVTQGISALLFAWYGFTCLFSRRMVADFIRYNMPHLRVLTGALQIAASLGIVLGHFYRPLLLLSSGGLAVMMLIALATRFRVQDALYLAIPSFALCLLNAFIFYQAF